MKEEQKIILVFVLVLLLGAWYWFALRPSNAKKTCHVYASEETRKSNWGVYNPSEGWQLERYNRIYGDCLRAKGL